LCELTITVKRPCVCNEQIMQHYTDAIPIE
jgi:hypothetical protein